MAGGIDIGGISASLEVDSGRVPEGLAKARQAMEAIAAELKRLQADFAAGSIGLQSFTDRSRALAQVQQDLSAKMRTAFTSINSGGNALDVLNAGMQKGGDAAPRMSRGMLQLGYMADDIRYGFGAIVNNIGPLVQGLTGNQGLAGATQIAAVAGYELCNNWDRVREAFGDTSQIQEAMRSLEGMSERLKTLSEDAASFSFGDKLAWMLGYNPDAGKARAADDLKQEIKARGKNKADAKSLEGFHSDAERKAADRFKDAVGEAGGIDAISERIGSDDYDKNGAGHYLSVEKSKAGFGESEAEEYDRLSRMKADDMSDRDRTRKSDLESKAQIAARDRARERIGESLYDKDKQVAIGDQYGGKAGDLLAGRTLTEKEKADKAKADKKESDKLNGKLRDEIELKGPLDAQEARKREDALSPANIARARDKRRQDNRGQAEERIPGFGDLAEQITASGMLQGATMSQIGKAIAQAAEEAGIDKGRAGEIGNDAAGRAQQSILGKANRKALNGGADDGKPASFSEVYATEGLTHKIQSSISDKSTDEKKIDLISKCVDSLAEIAKTNGKVFKFKVN